MKNLKLLIGVLGWTSLASAQPFETISEKDFLSEVPIVLSVSRLPQRLDETPGAVTLLDRDMIRLSGARDVADLMRLVPGFRVSNSFESGAPQVSYHNNLTAYANRIQLLVDGRSVYSPFFLGQTSTGMETVAIEDIERIEVLRGSNSAAYGARAFLGIINIVTRDPVDTLGLGAHGASGDNGISDARASLGWAAEAGKFRLGVDRRADNGLLGSSGPDKVSRVNFRGDLRLGAADQLEVRAGQTLVEAGVGFLASIQNYARQRSTEMSFVQLDWRRSLNENEDVALSFSTTNESTQDTFPVVFNLAPLLSGNVAFDSGGKASSEQLSFQHTVRQSNKFRFVWGAELRQERIVSKPLYDTNADFVTDFSRLFGNAEWRLQPSLILNAGGLLEKSSINGDSFMPRAMLNWHVMEGQTLRWGVSRAQRPPSTYEKFGNTRYYLDVNGAPGVVAVVVSRGGVQPEKVLSREIGYLGDFPRLGVNLDVRVFHEEVRDSIKDSGYAHPDASFLTNFQVADFANVENFDIHGIEYQLKWRPWPGGQVILNQSLVDSSWTDGGNNNYKQQPYLSSGLMVMQKLPGGADLSLMYHQTDTTNFAGTAGMAPAMSRTDARLAWPLRFGAQRGEVSLVVQNLGPANPDFMSNFYFRRQAFVMLKLDN